MPQFAQLDTDLGPRLPVQTLQPFQMMGNTMATRQQARKEREIIAAHVYCEYMSTCRHHDRWLRALIFQKPYPGITKYYLQYTDGTSG